MGYPQKKKKKGEQMMKQGEEMETMCKSKNLDYVTSDPNHPITNSSSGSCSRSISTSGFEAAS